jgi:hypothetical protein
MITLEPVRARKRCLHPIFFILAGLRLCSAPAVASASPGGSGQDLAASGSVPSAQTPVGLREFWLRFHETGLCQELDTVFSFQGKGLEIWCVADDEKNYRKLKDLAAASEASRSITVYATRSPAGKKKPDLPSPPPSLWNNEELVGAIQHTPVWSLPGGSAAEGSSGNGRVDVVKQRLIIYAERLLDWSGKLRRSGAELPALVRLGMAPELPPAQRRRVLALCHAHAQEANKNASRLSDNMSPAIPKSGKRPDAVEKQAAPKMPDSPGDLAGEIERISARVARGVHRFLYPREHTVELGDLREPELLESLKTLRETIPAFQKSLSRDSRR